MTAGDEAALMAEFKRTAPALQSGMPIPARHIAWLTIGQHHGLPTRLLDWTESSLVALYFAVGCAPEPLPDDPAVWMLMPEWLNEHARMYGGVYMISAQAQDRKLDRRWGLLTGTDPVTDPIAIRSVQITARISAQHGVFTLFGTDPDGLEQWRSHDGALLTPIGIESDAVAGIREELRQAGVTARTIFPDLDGLSCSLKAWWTLRIRAQVAARSSTR